MEKLEYISLYLPYRIYGKYRLGDVINNTPNPDEIRIKYLKLDNIEFFVNFCKPVLRPLSELTREEYWKLSGKDEKQDFGFWFCTNKTEGDYLHFEGYSSRKYFKNDFGLIPFDKIQFLLKHKFDIFGLIDKGLAITS